MPGESDPLESIVLMADPRVTGVPVSENGEDLVDARDYGLRVSSFRADDIGDFAHVRAVASKAYENARGMRGCLGIPAGTV